MKKEILALLTAKFAGVRKDGLEHLARVLALQATTEEEATALVEKLTDTMVNKFVKEYRSDVDRETTLARKTIEENLRKKYGIAGTEPNGGGENNDNEPNDITAAVKAAVAEAVKPLRDELDKYKAGDVVKTRLQSLNEKLNACKDEAFKAKALKDFSRMKFETDDEFTEYLTDTEKDITDANQRIADSVLGGQTKPFFGDKGKEGVSTAVEQYIEAKAKTSLGGKEI